MDEGKRILRQIWLDAQDRPLTYYLSGFSFAIIGLLTGMWVSQVIGIIMLTLAIFASSDQNLIMEPVDEGD